MEKNLVETERISVRRINKNVAKSMIEKCHYTHAMSSCNYALGVFYRQTDNHRFFEGVQEKLIGCLTYGHPVGSRAVKSISEELQSYEVLELTRLFIFDGFGKNIESYVISQSFRWLRSNAPEIKILISYADPEQNHLGLIYQATNWMYQGRGHTMLMPSFSIRLTKNGDWIHSRSVGARFKSRNVEHLKKVIGKTFWRKEESPKHRYIYFLCDKREKKRLIKTLKYPLMNYPKNPEQFKPKIQTIEVKQEKEFVREIKN